MRDLHIRKSDAGYVIVTGDGKEYAFETKENVMKFVRREINK